jgi:hypothetical protein
MLLIIVGVLITASLFTVAHVCSPRELADVRQQFVEPHARPISTPITRG